MSPLFICVSLCICKYTRNWTITNSHVCVVSCCCLGVILQYLLKRFCGSSENMDSAKNAEIEKNNGGVKSLGNIELNTVGDTI